MVCTVHLGQVGWAEVEHWMWPLFAPKWMQWRQQRLGMPPMLSQCTEHMSDDSSQPQAKRLRLTEVPHAVADMHCPSQSPDNSSTTGAAAEARLQDSTEAVAAAPLPSPVQLLYGLSPQVIQQPGYWPDSIHMCGFWQPVQHKKVSLAVTATVAVMSAAPQ